MKPGSALDALVAEKVMNWKLYTGYLSVPVGVPGCDTNGLTKIRGWNAFREKECPQLYLVSPYSTSIEAAWEVLEKIKRQGLILIPEYNIVAQEDLEADRDDYGYGWYVEGESMPHAVCLAALKAVGHSL